MKSQTGYWLIFLVVLLPIAMLVSNCAGSSKPTEEQQAGAALANPASQNCVD